MLLKYSVAPEEIEWDSEAGSVRLRNSGTLLYREFADVCLPERKRIGTLAQLGAKFIRQGQELFVEIDGVRMRLQTREELFILDELYVHNCYQAYAPGDPLVLDIGLNVGFSSLFLAKRLPTSQIVGYELMRPTFEAAQANLALNPELARRIEAQCVGASDKDATFTLKYNPHHRGSIGLYDAPKWAQAENTQTVEAQVRDAAQLVDEACARYPNRPVMMKIDCEGEEYAIIRRLHVTGKLERVQLLMIEWHRMHHWQNPEELCRDLQQAGFGTLLTESRLGNIGMLYAFRLAIGTSSALNASAA
jgi:FkbM family methyltransferase